MVSLPARFSSRLLTALLMAFVIISAVPPSVEANGTWTRQRAGSLAWLHSLFFLDQNRGWAAGSRGTLLLTTDGGATWEAKSRPTSDTIRDIYFIDDLNGFLVCERNIYDLKLNDEPRAYLMQTSDGGDQWKRLNLRGADADIRIIRAIFNKAGQGWAVGEGGVIYATDDAGANWMRMQSPTRFLLLGGAFIDRQTGWLVGAGSTILQTSDGGQSWATSRIPGSTPIRFTSASFVDQRFGWAVGSGGAIYCTMNGGRSWQAQSSGVTADLLDVKFLDSVEGWVVGADGTLLHTNSGGLVWKVEHSGTPHMLERIFFTDRNHGWAVGFGGTIVAYRSGGTPPGLHR